ncbi:fibronectin type III domain-containing protein [Fulvivirga sp.]|uniref:leucine-rich repeat domain-containing protein n=1 Tax=Fulvivirga sp. TaxID=1931237 RepID=UPI0032EC3EA4
MLIIDKFWSVLKQKLNNNYVIVLFNFIVISSYSSTSAQDISTFINFGLDNNVQAPWNNTLSAPSSGFNISNLLDENGVTQTMSHEIETDNWGGSQSGVYDEGAQTGDDSGVYPDAVMKEYYYFGTFGGNNPVIMKLTGLDTSKEYDLIFFGSSIWSGESDNGTTQYAAGGQIVSLDVQGNTSQTAEISGLQSDVSGEILITLSKASGTPVGYINAMQVVSRTPLAVSPPSTLVLSNNTSLSVSMNWIDNSENESGFEIYRASSSGGPYDLVSTVNKNVTNFTDFNRTPQTSYFYVVKSFNSSYHSSYSNELGVTTGDPDNEPRSFYVNFNRYSPAGTPWNNFDLIPLAGTSLQNIIDHAGNTSTVSITLLDDWTNTEVQGTSTSNNSGVFPDNVMKSYYRIYSGSTSIKVSGLDPTGLYDFGFLSSRNNEFNSLTYIIINEDSILTDAAYNQSVLGKLMNVQPDVNGDIFITVRNASEHGSSQGYINGLEMIKTSSMIQPSMSYLIDLGNPANPTPGNWNNVSGNQEDGATIADLITNNGNYSRIKLVVVDDADNGFGQDDGYNTSGYNGSVLGYPITACSDSYFAYGPGGIYKLTGLKSYMQYSVKIFASRTSSTGDRTGSYTINGTTLTLDAENNASQFITFNDLIADENGEVILDFELAPGSNFGYINVLELTETGTLAIQTPDNFNAALNNPTTVDLTWSDNANNETGYFIERKAQGESNFTSADITANSTSYVDTGLEYNTSYQYRITAYNASDTSLSSRAFTIQTGSDPNAAPATTFTYLIDLGDPANPTAGNWNNVSAHQEAGVAIQGLVNSIGNYSDINFEVVNEAHHDYGEGTNSEGHAGSAFGYPSTACSDSYFAYSTGGIYKLTGLKGNTNYSIKIFGSRASTTGGKVGNYFINGVSKTLDAQNNASEFISFENLIADNNGEIKIDFGLASGSNFAYINVLELTETVVVMIDAPEGLVATLSDASSISLTWSDNADNEIGYRLERRIEGESVFDTIDLPANTTSYDDVGLNYRTSYEYRVTAYSATDISLTSEVAMIETGIDPAESQFSYLIDLGDPAIPTSGNWNNVTVSQNDGATISDLINSDGISSQIAFVIIDDADNGFGDGSGHNTQGYAGAVLGYPATACSDSYFAYGPGGTYKFTGLNEEMVYSVKIFGSRVSTSGDRTGSYQINGLTQTLDGENNATEFIVFEDLTPDPNGEIILDFGLATGSSFGYINVIELIERGVVEPPSSGPITWTDLIGVEVQADNSLLKTASWGTNNAGAASEEVLAANTDGWVEFTTNVMGRDRFIGLSNTNLNASNSIDYAIRITSSEEYIVTESGSWKFTGGTIEDGDIFRVERIGTTIEYKRNGVIFYTSSKPSTTSLIVDAALYHSGGEINGAVISFGTLLNNGEVNDLAEIQALRDLYESTDGANWTDNSGWPTTAAEWETITSIDQMIGWKGVTVSAGDIIYLTLTNLNLKGEVPSSLGNLDKLIRLHLNNNNLSGTIPQELGGMSSLLQLHLNGNSLTGSIPSSLGNLALLNSLELGYNQLEGEIPSELGNLLNMTSLKIESNKFSGSIPSSLGNLTELVYLQANSNELTGEVPSSLGNLDKLIRLHLNNNNLSGTIPQELGGMRSLTQLYLNNNLFNSIQDFSSSTTVTIWNVKVEYNYIPQDQIGINQNIFTSYTHSPQLVINGNAIDVIEIAALKDLHESTNGANWTNNTNWPSTTAEWDAITSIDQVDSWHGVTISDGDVQEIKMINNGLVGQIPASIGNFSGLKFLRLQSNQLSGEIPVTIGNLESLEWLYLSNNNLNGAIPQTIGNLTSLERLVLFQNQLSGSIPSSIVNLTNLVILELYQNTISGAIPNEIGQLTNLVTLHLSNNQFSGNIPTTISQLSNIQNFYAANNLLTGEIPKGIENWTYIKYIYLNNNQLSGEIDVEFSHLTNLRTIFLNNNELSGSIPNGLLNAPYLNFINAGYNNFTTLPDLTLHSNVSGLKLYVGSNQLTFDQIEKNLTGPDTHPFAIYTYGAQKSPDNIIQLPAGYNQLLVNDRFEGANNSFQWQKLVDGSWQDIPENANNLNYTVSETFPGEKYRCLMTNSWVSGVEIYSSTYEITDYVSFVYYAIADGNWNDPAIWSSDESGEPANSVPTVHDVVVINDHAIIVTESVDCKEVNLISTGKGNLTVSGEESVLRVLGEMRVRNNASNKATLFRVVEGGKIECE